VQNFVSNKSTILRKLLKKLILLLLVLINSKIDTVKIIMKNAATVVLICFLCLLNNLVFLRYEDLHGRRRYVKQTTVTNLKVDFVKHAGATCCEHATLSIGK